MNKKSQKKKNNFVLKYQVSIEIKKNRFILFNYILSYQWNCVKCYI